jgi:DNA-binding transcriptional LysR family regulator
MAPSDRQPNSLLESKFKLRHFRLLAAIDEHRNIVRAAESIGISQPGASKLLAEMEKYLGARLFERRARGLEPYEMGSLLIRRSHVIISVLDKAGSDFYALKAGHAGSVNAGALGTRGLELITAAANRMRLGGKHPFVQSWIDVGNTEYLMKHLADGVLDCVIGWVTPDIDLATYAVETIEHEKFCFICREGHPLLRKDRVELEDLVEAEWVLQSPDSLVRRAAEALFAARGLPAPTPVITSTSLLSMLVFLQDTDAISVATATAVRRFSSAGGFRVLTVVEPVAPERVAIIVLNQTGMKPSVRLFLDVVRQAAAIPADVN